MQRRLLTTLAAVVVLAVQASPVWAAIAAAPKRLATTKKPATKQVTVVTKTVKGLNVKCKRWGFIQIALTVKQTVTTVGTKKTVAAVKITNIAEPIFPDHTDRSIYINKQALPLLNQEVQQLQLNSMKLEEISGATNTSDAFLSSLQAALLAAKQA